MKRTLSSPRGGGLVASLLMMMVASNLAFAPSSRRTPAHVAVAANTRHTVFTAKKTIEDANGISEVETSDGIKGKRSKDKKTDSQAIQEIDSFEEIEESTRIEETNKTETVSIVADKAEDLDQSQNTFDTVQNAADEEFMHLAIDAAITG